MESQAYFNLRAVLPFTNQVIVDQNIYVVELHDKTTFKMMRLNMKVKVVVVVISIFGTETNLFFEFSCVGTHYLAAFLRLQKVIRGSWGNTSYQLRPYF